MVVDTEGKVWEQLVKDVHKLDNVSGAREAAVSFCRFSLVNP